MEEQEKIDIREHLIGWIDSFLEDGIIPQVVNPKAIRANYILKSKIKEKIEEQLKEAEDVLENENYLDNFNGNKSEQKYYYEGYKDATIFISELMEDK